MTTPTHPDDYASTRHDTEFFGGESGAAHHVPFERIPPLADMPAADGDDSPFESVAHPSELTDGEPTGHDAAEHAAHHTELHADQQTDQHSEQALEYERPDDELWHQDAHGAAHEHVADEGGGGSHAGNGLAAPDHAIGRPAAGPVTTPARDSVSAAADARGMLEGVAQSLRTLAGREGADGASIAIFPRGVNLLEVRMHISRDRDIDLNFRVAGPTPPGSSI
jgi:hypothetical protein